MRYLKLTIVLLILLFTSFCKKNTRKRLENNKNEKQINIIDDTLINNIDSSKIVDLKLNKQKIVELFFKSFQKNYSKPIINFDRVKNTISEIEVKKYIDFKINGAEYQSYLISFYYENDGLYKSILLTNTILDDGLIIYEKVLDEGEYLRTTTIKKNILTNFIFQVEHFTYDREGNISGDLEKHDSLLVQKNSYLAQTEYLSEYYDEVNSKINKEWGKKEVIYTKDGVDSSYVFLYKQKGKVKNHIKVGKWEERRYINEYDKSVWLDGEYINGLRNGEWSYSPYGPVDKIEVYDMGKLIKTYFP